MQRIRAHRRDNPTVTLEILDFIAVGSGVSVIVAFPDGRMELHALDDLVLDRNEAGLLIQSSMLVGATN